MSTKEEFLFGSVIPAKVEFKNNFILKHCSVDSKILDVGCIGQAIDYNSNLWLHGTLVKHSNNVTGVDINKEKIDEVKAAGYKVFAADELQKSDTFDVIVMGDIIEHISDIKNFLDFYKNFLKPNGKIIITTPNPFSFRQLLNIFFFKRPFINEEHTCYLDPFTMLEVLQRSNMSITDFAWIHEHNSPKTLTSRVLFGISKMLYQLRKYYAPNFGVVCSNNQEFK